MDLRRWTACSFLLAVLAFGAGAGTGQAEDAWSPPGPAVGARFPSGLELPDQAGVKRSLAALQGARGTILVFVRSADWCPYCMRQLADTDGAVVQSLGIRDPAYGPDSDAFGVPQPVIFVLDRAQVVRAKFAERGYRNRPDLDRMLGELARLDLG
jgi:peroxiredoxin